MKLSYPSKNFIKEASKAIDAREILEFSIKRDGWRGRVLAKQVGSWPSTSDVNQIDGVRCKAPSLVCSWFMMPLLTVYFLALSAQYKMCSEVNDDLVVLIYVPIS